MQLASASAEKGLGEEFLKAFGMSANAPAITLRVPRDADQRYRQERAFWQAPRCGRDVDNLIWAAILYQQYGYKPVKTTIEISDPLLREARKLAQREGVTLRALVERGLNRVIGETKHAAPFKLRRAAFKGKGLQAEFGAASWDTLRDEIYRGRGG
jgi:hypothetical protein